MLAQPEAQKDLAVVDRPVLWPTRDGVLPAAGTDPRGDLSIDQGDTRDVYYLSLPVPSHCMAKSVIPG